MDITSFSSRTQKKSQINLPKNQILCSSNVSYSSRITPSDIDNAPSVIPDHYVGLSKEQSLGYSF